MILFDLLERLRGLTAGPAAAPEVPDGPVSAPHPCFVDGWWEHATRRPAHPGRVGGAIRPWSVVAHTTDMLPSEWPALLSAWTTRPGDGACAHFAINRDGTVVQFIPIDRNGNHAGGPGHGVYAVGSTTYHPNLVAVGIELHNAGGVRRINGQWRLVEGGAPRGEALPDADVAPDPQRPGRGWHRPTDVQLERLAALLGDLDAALGPVPAGATARSSGEIPPEWAWIGSARVVTHAWLDPAHRADPWPVVCDWLRARRG